MWGACFSKGTVFGLGVGSSVGVARSRCQCTVVLPLVLATEAPGSRWGSAVALWLGGGNPILLVVPLRPGGERAAGGELLEETQRSDREAAHAMRLHKEGRSSFRSPGGPPLGCWRLAKAPTVFCTSSASTVVRRASGSHRHPRWLWRTPFQGPAVRRAVGAALVETSA